MPLGKYIKIPLSEITNPQQIGTLKSYHNQYWLLDDKDNAIFYYYETLYPQCNSDPNLVQMLANKYKNTKIRQISWAYISNTLCKKYKNNTISLI